MMTVKVVMVLLITWLMVVVMKLVHFNWKHRWRAGVSMQIFRGGRGFGTRVMFCREQKHFLLLQPLISYVTACSQAIDLFN